MKKILPLLVMLVLSVFLSPLSSNARYNQTCVVKYMTQSGWSKKYTVDVTFMMGSELNTATNSYNYSMYSTYAIIFWDKGQATVIKLSSYLTCGNEVTKTCITSAYGPLKGKDQDDDEWSVCISDYCI